MATPLSNSVGLTSDPRINGLMQGSSWTFQGQPRQLTYSLNLNFDIDTQGTVTAGVGGTWPANPAIADAVARALAAWSTVANIGFSRITSGTYLFQSTADIAFALTGDDLQAAVGAVGLGFFPDPAYATASINDFGYTRTEYPRPEGDVLLDNFYSGFASVADGSFGYWAILHEIGHALGLKHPFDDGGNNWPTFSQGGISNFDNERYTLMSYSNIGTFGSAHAATPMLYDILAIQEIYGANLSYHNGDDVYAIGTGAGSRTIWDTGGTDTVDLSAMNNGVFFDMREGTLNDLSGGSVWLAIAYNVTIENFTGSAYNDWVWGNAAANAMIGNAGENTLFGGPGDDTYYLSGTNDLVKEAVNEGIDTVYSSVDYTLLTGGFGSGAQSIEYILLTGNANINAVGNQVTLQITGNSGNNQLDDNYSAMILAGGMGDDAFVVGNAATTVLESDSQGTDTVWLTLVSSWTLAANVENLGVYRPEFSGAYTMTGNARSNTITGGIMADTMDGADGNDSLDGGEGNDSLAGGAGFDTIYGGIGNDHINGGNNADRLYGGDGNDSMFGGKSADLLDGGNGDDVLFGQVGNDSLYGGNGMDTADYGAGDAVTVNLSLGGGGSTVSVVGVFNGTDALLSIENVIGSAFADSIFGDLGVNVLTGGTGNDTLSASDGADTIFGDDGNDVIAGGAGGDSILGGTGNDNIGGGKGGDQIFGEDGDDTINGNLGNDQLTGGLGADKFVFNSALSVTTNVDTIFDFTHGTDIIHLSASILTAFSGQVGQTIGTNGNLLYDNATGVLSYDADGAGGAAATNFAIIGSGVHPGSMGNVFLIIA